MKNQNRKQLIYIVDAPAILNKNFKSDNKSKPEFKYLNQVTDKIYGPFEYKLDDVEIIKFVCQNHDFITDRNLFYKEQMQCIFNSQSALKFEIQFITKNRNLQDMEQHCILSTSIKGCLWKQVLKNYNKLLTMKIPHLNYPIFYYMTKMRLLSQFQVHALFIQQISFADQKSKILFQREQVVLQMLKESLTALKSLHDNGIFHNNISASNLYIVEGHAQLGPPNMLLYFDQASLKQQYLTQEMIASDVESLGFVFSQQISYFNVDEEYLDFIQQQKQQSITVDIIDLQNKMIADLTKRWNNNISNISLQKDPSYTEYYTKKMFRQYAMNHQNSGQYDPEPMMLLRQCIYLDNSITHIKKKLVYNRIIQNMQNTQNFKIQTLFQKMISYNRILQSPISDLIIFIELLQNNASSIEHTNFVKRNQYTLQEQIGKGSFGHVYKARDMISQEIVAVKVSILNQFNEIAKCINELKHCRIIRVLNAFKFCENGQQQYYVVMNFCENSNINDFLTINRKQCINISKSVINKWIYQILDVIACLHKNNIIHRDLKLENCLLDEQLNVYLCDFEQAIQLNSEQFQDSKFVGTLTYAAPECIQKFVYSKASDCWSVGCIIWQLLYGQQRATNSDFSSPSRKQMPLFTFATNSMKRPTIQHFQNYFSRNIENYGVTQSIVILKNRFQILQQYNIGKICIDLKTGGEVFAKCITTANRDKQTMANPKMEIAIQSNLYDKNIVNAIDNFEEQGLKYVVMKFYKNGDARSYFNTGKCKYMMIIKWMKQSISALSYLHNVGIMHRDIKLENFFLDDDYNLLLGDFGEARNDVQSFALTMCGTTSNMAPEILNSQPYDAKCDVWSLGCVWYELMTKKHPFKNKINQIEMNTIELIMIGQYKKMDKPFHFSNIINSMLQLDTTKRPTANFTQKLLQQEFIKYYKTVVFLPIVLALLITISVIFCICGNSIFEWITKSTCNSDYYYDNSLKICSCKNIYANSSCVECAMDSVSNGSSCLCDSHRQYDSHQNKCICDNQTLLLNNLCSYCPLKSIINKITCICSDNLEYIRQSNLCVCPISFSILNDSSCTICPSFSSSNFNNSCICNSNMIYNNISNMCQCNVSQVFTNQNGCQYCPLQSYYENSQCVCNLWSMIYNSAINLCECTMGLIIQSGLCLECPHNSIFDNGTCLCQSSLCIYDNNLNSCVCSNYQQCQIMTHQTFLISDFQQYDNQYIFATNQLINFNNSQFILQNSTFQNIQSKVSLFWNVQIFIQIQISGNIIIQNTIELALLEENQLFVYISCCSLQLEYIILDKESNIAFLTNNSINQTLINVALTVEFDNTSQGRCDGLFSIITQGCLKVSYLQFSGIIVSSVSSCVLIANTCFNSTVVLDDIIFNISIQCDTASSLLITYIEYSYLLMDNHTWLIRIKQCNYFGILSLQNWVKFTNSIINTYLFASCQAILFQELINKLTIFENLSINVVLSGLCDDIVINEFKCWFFQSVESSITLQNFDFEYTQDKSFQLQQFQVAELIDDLNSSIQLNSTNFTTILCSNNNASQWSLISALETKYICINFTQSFLNITCNMGSQVVYASIFEYWIYLNNSIIIVSLSDQGLFQLSWASACNATIDQVSFSYIMKQTFAYSLIFAIQNNNQISNMNYSFTNLYIMNQSYALLTNFITNASLGVENTYFYVQYNGIYYINLISLQCANCSNITLNNIFFTSISLGQYAFVYTSNGCSYCASDVFFDNNMKCIVNGKDADLVIDKVCQR